MGECRSQLQPRLFRKRHLANWIEATSWFLKKSETQFGSELLRFLEKMLTARLEVLTITGISYLASLSREFLRKAALSDAQEGGVDGGERAEPPMDPPAMALNRSKGEPVAVANDGKWIRVFFNDFKNTLIPEAIVSGSFSTDDEPVIGPFSAAISSLILKKFIQQIDEVKSDKLKNEDI
ncbi:hypothetical protein L2E82_02221 [Cichorium intybus]|uniref:Uncharacterized protein n=1 Tax=Cichorium intybus TaxID=13427 RepID=A0ACB9H1P8_CICIN|nr:hypothetical protein L2E82_02221 [Cichorium intybus]